MRFDLWAKDVRSILVSRRTGISISIMLALATVMAIIARLAPEGLRTALEDAAPGSSSVFEYMWFEEILDKLLLLVMVSYGSFSICDIEDEGMTGLSLSRSQTRFEFVIRRITASLSSLLLVLIAGSALGGAIGWAIAGEMDLMEFLTHLLIVIPMFIFVFSLTFLLSVPLRNTAPTVICSFGIALALSFTYTFLLLGSNPEPSIFNPLALGHRILMSMPLEGAIAAALGSSALMLGGGTLWFLRKDL